MNVFRCYTRAELSDFMLGKLEAQKTEEITQHLDQCHICEDTVVGLEKSSDTLVNLLAGAPTDSSPAAYDKNPDYERAATAAQQVISSWVAHTESIPNRTSDHKTIGDYEIVQTLARGGMGSVFRARHMRLEKEVAIKILPERKMQSPDAIARFSREMKIIGQMSHPSMVAATDAGAVDGIHYLVMELVDGIDLGKLVRRCGPLNVADACELIRQSALGIQYAHDQDVIHRDVKPSNLMLASDSMVKVLDLGLATLGGLTGTVDELTTVGQLMGTLDYMAPEQCGNSQPVEAQCDIYGLGATLYKLIAGVAPYSSPDNDTPLKKLRAMATCEPTPIVDRIDGLPDELVSIINRCLADLPKDRFDSAADLAEALLPLCADHDLPALLARASIVAEDSNCLSGLPNSNSKSGNRNRPAREKSRPKTKTASDRSRGRWIPTAIALALASAALLGGILIYLSTTAGQLIIESEVQDVRVTVMKNDSPTKDVQVEQGRGSTKLRAGQYQIVIDSDSDELAIDNDNFVLRKGETVVARITRKADIASDLATKTNQPTTASADTYLIESMEDRLNNLKKARRELLHQRLRPVAGWQYDNLKGNTNHPAVVAYDELIAETKKKLEGELPPRWLNERRLFELRKIRATVLARNGKTENIDRDINSQLEFMEEQEEASKLRGSTAAAGNSRPIEASATKSNDTLAKPSPNDPTYNGKGIEYWIENSISGTMQFQRSPDGSSTRDRILRIIRELSPLLSQQRKKEIVESQLNKYRHEISEGLQTRIALSLAPLCETDELFDKLFDFVSLSDPSALETSSPVRFQTKMIWELGSEDPQRHAKSIQWAETRARKQPGLQPLVPQWKDALLKRIDNTENHSKILNILMISFPSDPKVIDAIYASVSKDEPTPTKADKYAYLSSLGYLLRAKPKDKQIPLKAIQLLKAGICDPNYLVDLALYQAEEKQDHRLLDQLVELLMDGSWGLTWAVESGKESGGDGGDGGLMESMKSNMLGGGDDLLDGLLGRGGGGGGDEGYGDGGFDKDAYGLRKEKEIQASKKRAARHSLVKAIGEKVNEISRRAGDKPPFQKLLLKSANQKLLPALYKQFDFKFVIDDFFAEKVIDKNSDPTWALHYLANQAIAEITGVKASDLHNGYDIKHWVARFQAAKTDSEKLQTIQNVYALRQSSEFPDDLALSIAKGVRGLSFDYVDLSDKPDAEKSVQALAIELFWKNKKPLKLPNGRRTPDVNYQKELFDNQPMLKHFVDSLDQLADEDAMFALWVMREVPKENPEVLSYARLYQGVNNPLLHVRATSMRFYHGYSTHSSADRMKIISSNLEEKSLSTLQKLMILSMLRRPIGWNEWPSALSKLVNEIDDPRQLATLFSLERKLGQYNLETVALELIAKDPDYLHDVHNQLSLSRWVSPEERERSTSVDKRRFNSKSKQTLLDLCLTQLDKMKKFDLRRLSQEKRNKAIGNLESIKTTATDVQRNRIDRILKLITPLDSEDSH